MRTKGGAWAGRAVGAADSSSRVDGMWRWFFVLMRAVVRSWMRWCAS